ncbi:hypothetical protein ABEB36_004503 [Hypothenemus hampei]|uniref:Uncharacterized protein n=1 Tax=Hypothenemus hampei TaxID=57062 RepID=A0ABD1F3K2_HYPHA
MTIINKAPYATFVPPSAHILVYKLARICLGSSCGTESFLTASPTFVSELMVTIEKFAKNTYYTGLLVIRPIPAKGSYCLGDSNGGMAFGTSCITLWVQKRMQQTKLCFPEVCTLTIHISAALRRSQLVRARRIEMIKRATLYTYVFSSSNPQPVSAMLIDPKQFANRFRPISMAPNSCGLLLENTYNVVFGADFIKSKHGLK